MTMYSNFDGNGLYTIFYILSSWNEGYTLVLAPTVVTSV